MSFFSMIKVLLLCTTSLSLLLTSPASGKGSNFLLNGERLNTDEALIEGDSKLIMEEDCSLVLYNGKTQTWSPNTKKKGLSCHLTLLANGNLIIYDNEGYKRWQEGPNGPNGNYILILKSNNDLIRFGPNAWSPISKLYGSDDDVVMATALNGTTGVNSGEEQNNVREMGKIMEVIGDE